MIEVQTTLTSVQQDLEAYAGVYYNVFLVKAADVQELMQREKNASRVIFSINGEGRIYRAFMPDGNGDFFLLINQEICKQFNLEPEVPVTLQIFPDDSEYGMPLPEELSELWTMDEDAYRVFHLLTPGKQRGLIYQIAKPKGADTRVKKAVQISEYLKSVNGKLDYKELNAYIKADNANW
ncbi:YdeI/OmpD-associated family protein [Neolewinella persica]|uniref:YdeI/OmpD-associated family protein n=1 Tax=Neolewinella persica TaxID=70998 RepID=UPI0003772031|nr:YdeI/OmpD-associated family protein [Neolewinella persica]